MKDSILVLCTLFLGTGFAEPVVSGVSFVQEPDVPHVACISYSLHGAPAIVTIDIQTNTLANGTGMWVSIGGEHQWRIGGDVNRKILGDGVKRAFWCPDAEWENRSVPPAQIRAKVSAWDPFSPPDYLAADLLQPSNVFYYASESFVPETPTNNVYKESVLLMRKIPAKDVSWVMGNSAVDERTKDYYKAEAMRHKVKLSHDYFMGVFELTIAQYAYCKDITAAAALPSDDDRCNHLPKGQLKRQDIRSIETWPTLTAGGALDILASRDVGEGTAMAKLRGLTGLYMADLPTEAEWEFACRAGTEGPYYDNLPYSDENISKIARYLKNQNEEDCDGLSGLYASVGSYKSNPWGLYDTIGNVMEWCLDQYEDFSTCQEGGPIDAFQEITDPYGATASATSATMFVLRGGSTAQEGVRYISAHCRGYHYAANFNGQSAGCRVVVMIGEEGVE